MQRMNGSKVEVSSLEVDSTKTKKEELSYMEWKPDWVNLFRALYGHVFGVYGLYLLFTSAKIMTIGYGILCYIILSLGITAGGHRLWTHRSYKVEWPLHLCLVIFQTMSFQYSVLRWVRYHRTHHKFTDTDADPHNSRRGFFFSHIGWLLIQNHPKVLEKQQTIDMTDLQGDPLLVFQDRYFLILGPVLTFVLRPLVPWYFWGESIWVSIFGIGFAVWAIHMHGTFFVNSITHRWGTRPYDRTIRPTENQFVVIVSIGEGYHNYHHVFPWDYKTSEYITYGIDLTTAFINFCAWIGLAYDLKSVSPKMIERRVNRSGDGNWIDNYKQTEEKLVWGWGDPDMSIEDVKDVSIVNKA